MTQLTLEPAAFLDLWRDKFFLGREFLTWLWINSAIEGEIINVEGLGHIELWFENKIQLERGEGGDKKSVSCQEPGNVWPEIYAALRDGKLITKCHLTLRTEDKEWGFSLNADCLTPQTIKMPRTFTEGEEVENSLVGKCLERITLALELNTIIDSLLEHFFGLRLTPEWASVHMPKMCAWLSTK